ncbi:alpha/beta fold hydrolase [Rhizobium leguminosarum]
MNIVLVPGFMATKSLWDDVISDLEKIGPITHANLCDGTSIRDIAQRAITHAPESFALIGFSMGGYVAREIARIASSRVEALVLIATSARADTPEQIIRKASASEQLRVSRFAGLSRATILQSLHPRNANNIAMVERVRRMSLDLGKDVFIRQVALERDGAWTGWAKLSVRRSLLPLPKTNCGASRKPRSCGPASRMPNSLS